jgi:hypothetical protein
MAAMTAKFRALAREAALAAEHLAIGATALSRANYAYPAYYYQAFFALSVGIERSAKLALTVDYALRNGGKFPSNATVRRYRHRLDDLLGDVEELARERAALERHAPSSPIHSGIITTLTDFAANVTRYYNIDLVTEADRIAGVADPVASWYTRVTAPILDAHYSPKKRARDEAQAAAMDILAGEHMLVRFHAETGEAITTVADGMRRSAANDAAKPWERMYVLHFARFIGSVMDALSAAAHGNEDIPHLPDFYAVYRNDDRSLRQRRSWSIHH